MFIYAFVIIAGLCMLVIPCVLLHHVLAHNRHSKWHTAAIITFVIVALAGSIMFCRDLWIYRKLWDDDSIAIIALNFVGILMGNSNYLLPTLLSFYFLYFGQWTGEPKKSPDGSGAES